MIINNYTPSEYKKANSDIINAGISNDNVKIIKLSKKYNNPRFYPRKFDKWKDEFSVTLSGDLISIRRTDVNVGGWGENLLIDVEFDAEKPNTELKEQKIPRVIYQTFETFDLPKGMFDAVNSWINLNSDYEHYFFNQEQRIEFIRKFFNKDVLNAYQSLIPGAFKADLWRCCVLYERGGVYVDSDMICLKSICEYLNPDDTFIIGRDDPMSKNYLSNGFIACIPKHEFLKAQIDSIVDNVLNHRIRYYLDISGPGLFGKSVNRVCGRPENTNFDLGINVINNFTFRVILHDWKTKTFKINDTEILLTEYSNKNEEMSKINNPSFYSLVQKNMIYQVIPRTIYYTSYDHLGINTYMYNSFKEKNTDWKLEYYSDDDCVEFLKKNNEKFKEIIGIDVLSFYLNLTNGGERSDFWRYCIMFLNGGVYSDADTYCNLDLNKWILHHDLIFGIEACLPIEEAKSFGMDKIGIVCGNMVISVCNWTFASQPNHDFFKNLIIDICKNKIENNVLLNTGPGRFTKHVMSYFYETDMSYIEQTDVIKDLSILYKINRFGSNQSHSNSIKNYTNPFDIKSDDVYVIHAFEGSWRTLKNKKINLFKSKLGVSHNISIEKKENGYFGIARLDKDTSRTQFMKKIGDCRSLVEYKFDENFNLIEEIEKPIINCEKISKFEDYRIFNYKNERFFSVSYIDEDFNTKVSILNSKYMFLGDVNIEKYNSVSWIGLNKIWEKNWLFFEKEDDLFFIYSTTPRFVIYKCNNFSKLTFEKFIDIEWPISNNVPEKEHYFTSYIGSTVKIATGGSTNPIFLKEKNVFLYFIHTRNYSEQKYNHYAVILNENLFPIKLIQEPVIKKYVPYELMFVSSVIETENYLIFSGGIRDNTNFIWELSKPQLFKLFGI